MACVSFVKETVPEFQSSVSWLPFKITLNRYFPRIQGILSTCCSAAKKENVIPVIIFYPNRAFPLRKSTMELNGGIDGSEV